MITVDPQRGVMDRMVLRFNLSRLTREYNALAQEIRYYRLKMENVENKTSPKDKKGELPGHIYVHSKVMTVNASHAILGSANINERSMWHDTETALAVHANARGSIPKILRDALISIVLNGKDLPKLTGDETDDAFEIFECFERHLNDNKAAYAEGAMIRELTSHVLPLKPKSNAFGSGPAS